VIRHKGSTYIKELTEEGIRITLIDKSNEARNYSYTLNDFKSEKVACTKGVGRVIVMSKLEPENLAPLIKTAEKLGFKAKEVSPFLSAVAFEYDCDKISLKNIHDLFFHQDVLILEPDVKVQASAHDYKCPDRKFIDCQPPVPEKDKKYCEGDYHEWIKKNCPDVKFVY
jgi:hypothetical protein